jgi:hypothetical protein
MWYLSPFACLYDLLQLAFGHLNGLLRSSEVDGRARVVEALGADLPDLSADDDEDALGVGLPVRELGCEPEGE